MSIALSKLFEPGSIGKMVLKNRIIMAPISTNLAGGDGQVTQELISHYAERAKGGAGLVTVENVCVDYPLGRHGAAQPRIDSEKIREILEENGVRVLLGQTIRGIYGDPVEGVRTEHEDVPCDAVIIALGTIPNTQFINADETALSARGAVVVDEHLRTSLESIYAAGECADPVDVLSGKRRVNLTWPAAIEQGKIAAMNMIRRKRTYRGSLSLNVIHVFDVPVASVGDLEGERVDRDYQGNLVQFIRQGERITGAQFVGYKDDSGIAQALVKNLRAQLEKWGSIEVSLTPYAMKPRWKMTGKGISNVVQVLRKEGE